MDHFNDYIDQSKPGTFKLKPEYKRNSYFVRNHGNDQIRFEYCMFKGCDVGFCGQNGYFRNATFSFVQYCIEGLCGNRIDIYSNLNVNNCCEFIDANYSSFIYASVGLTPCKWRIWTSNAPVTVRNAGNAVVAIYQNNVDIALVEDPNGTITIDGDDHKYKRAPSAQDAEKVNTNIAAFDFRKITPNSASTVANEKKQVVDPNNEVEISNFLTSFIGQNNNGYGSNGYSALIYGDANWLSLYSETNAPWKDYEIPGVDGEIDFQES